MGDRTGIIWTDATWNPVTGCTEVSPGCDHCYARALALGKLRAAYSRALPVVDTPENRADPFAVRFWPDRLDQPLRWSRPRMIFANSMSDLFHVDVPAALADQMFAVMALADWHVFQVLTKRPGRALRYIDGHAYGRWCEIAREMPCRQSTRTAGYPLPNLWLGTTVENADQRFRIGQLRQIPAAVRWLSVEPMLSEVPLSPADLEGIGWVVCGGESGPDFRPLNLDHARRLRDDCARAGVPFLFKQVGGRTPKAGGRLLDGETHDAYPGGPHA